MSFSNGISIWPAVIIRGIGVVVAWAFLCYTVCSLQANIYQLTKDFRLAHRERARGKTNKSFLRTLHLRWHPAPATEAKDLWHDYQRLAHGSLRWRRVAVFTTIYFLFGCSLFMANGIPTRPLRGGASAVMDLVVLFLFILIYVWFTFWIFDAVRLCQKLVASLTEHATKWPAATYARLRGERGHLADAYLEEWVEMQFIGRHTQAIERLIYMPFILLVIMLLARSAFFDHWSWPVALIAITGANTALASYSVISLKLSARHARAKAIASLEEKLWDAKVQFKAKDGDAAAAIQQIEKTIADIRHLRLGSFRPFLSSPFVQALLLSSGGYALIQIALKAIFAPAL